MDLKHAAVVCLISMFAATLVLLIARALDIQAASRLEPQLAKIVEELELLRRQGGGATPAGGTAASEAVDDCLMVYYFHGNTRCPTCRAIQSQSHDAVQSGFASQLQEGEIVWEVVNYEEPASRDLAREFEIQMPVVVLARMDGGQVGDWRRLDEVWGLVGDKPAFSGFLRDEISRMLGPANVQPASASNTDPPDIPLPDPDPPDIPVPTVPDDLPESR